MMARIQAGRPQGKTAECPSEESWFWVAAGIASGGAPGPLIEHAARCGYCGPLLREAAEDMALEPSAEDIAETGKLATPEWRKQMAQRLSDASRGTTPLAQPRRLAWFPRLSWAYFGTAA